MLEEKATRTLLGPADPARGVEVAPPRASAAELITWAEATTREFTDPPAPVGTRRRRLLAVAAAVVVVGSAAGYALSKKESPHRVESGTPSGIIVVPVAYEITASPPPAADRLRDLAARIVDAPADRRTGRYDFIHWKGWGDGVLTSPEGHERHPVDEVRTWTRPDGSGLSSTTMLPPEYTTEEARRYWEAHPLPSSPNPYRWPVEPIPPLPTDPVALRESLNIQYGPGAASKSVLTAYMYRTIPRAQRAAILRALADLDGFTWRGKVTDRAGRTGVAITADEEEHGQRYVLVFDPRTGDLLALELHQLKPLQVEVYVLIIEHDRTDTTG